ncbi:hypothetical protein ASE55_03935 [Chryseobacterium sp. Leaf201]|nr:hypothetical protein ASE55_03935 [Chryseobacterium sp. Leaf201]
MQQEPDDRKLVLAWENYTKLVHLSSPPVFEDNEGIISTAGIKEMIQWCKKKDTRFSIHVMEIRMILPKQSSNCCSRKYRKN